MTEIIYFPTNLKGWETRVCQAVVRMSADDVSGPSSRRWLTYRILLPYLGGTLVIWIPPAKVLRTACYAWLAWPQGSTTGAQLPRFAYYLTSRSWASPGQGTISIIEYMINIMINVENARICTRARCDHTANQNYRFKWCHEAFHSVTRTDG